MKLGIVSQEKKAPNFDLGLLIKLGYYNGPKKTAL